MTKHKANLFTYLPQCPICGKGWTWARITRRGGGDPDAPLTTCYDMAECISCGVRVEVDQPLNQENEE